MFLGISLVSYGIPVMYVVGTQNILTFIMHYKGFFEDIHFGNRQYDRYDNFRYI